MSNSESPATVEPLISEELANDILDDFLSSPVSIAELAKNYGIPLLAFLRWFKSDPIRQALDELEALQKRRQMLAACAAAPGAVARLGTIIDGTNDRLALSAGSALLRFAAFTSRPSPAPRKQRDPKPEPAQPTTMAEDPAPAPEPFVHPAPPTFLASRLEPAPSILDGLMCPSPAT